MRLVWPFSVNILLFAAGACVFPFYVLYYQSLGFTGPQIGLLTGLTPLISMVSGPLWANLADATRRHRLLMTVLLLIAAAGLVVFPLLRGFIPVMLMAFLYNACSAPTFSFIDNATMVMLGGRRDLYGRVRLGGTIGFGVAALVVGVLVQRTGLSTAFFLGGALLFGACLAAQPLDHRRPRAVEAKVGRVTDLLADARWWPFLLGAFAAGLGLTVSNTYLFPYMQELGAGEDLMGLSLTLGTIAEVPVFLFGSRLLRRFKPYTLFLLALALSGARMVLFYVSPVPGFVLVLQFLSGLTFPTMWLAGVAYADEHAPPCMGATAQGLFGAMIFGFGSAVGGFFAGPLLESVGGSGLFALFGLIMLGLTGLAALLHRRVRRGAAEPLAG